MNAQLQKYSLKKNDTVQVIAGREKGKIGKILKIDPKTGRVTVEKTNLVKRHTKPTSTRSGGIVEKELPLSYSNVLLFCGKCNRGVRHGVKLVEGSASSVKKTKTAVEKSTRKVKIRTCKRCQESLEQA